MFRTTPLTYMEPQSRRISEAGRDLCRSSGPSPLLKQGSLDPTALGYLQGWRLPSLSGQPAPGLSHSHKTKVSDGQIDPALIYFVPLSSVTSEKGPTPSFLLPPFRYLCPVMRFPLTLLPVLSALPHTRCSSPFTMSGVLLDSLQ